jgi:hypothetical protein
MKFTESYHDQILGVVNGLERVPFRSADRARNINGGFMGLLVYKGRTGTGGLLAS